MSIIEERIGAAQSRAEGTDFEESIAVLVRSREILLSDADTEGRNRERKIIPRHGTNGARTLRTLC